MGRILTKILLGFLVMMMAGAPLAGQGQAPRLNQGWVFFFQKRYDQALEKLQQDRRTFPNSAILIDGIGWCHYYLGDLGAAEKAFRQALEKDSTYRYSAMGLSLVVKARQAAIEAAENFMENGEVLAARLAYGELEKALSGMSTKLRRRVKLGHAKALLAEPRTPKDLILASRIYRDILKVDSRNSGAHQGMAQVFTGQRRYREAEASFAKALVNGGKKLSLRLAHAHCSALQNRPKIALERYREILRILPGSCLAHLGCVKALTALRQEEEAGSHLRQALALSPYDATSLAVRNWITKYGDESLWVDYSFACLAGGWPTAAWEVLIGRKSPEARLAMAMAALHLGDYSQALRLAVELRNSGNNVTRQITVLPTLAGKGKTVTLTVPAIRGWALLGLGDQDGAKDVFTEILTTHPDEPDALTGLGRVELTKGNHLAAERLFKTALEKLPGYTPAQTGWTKVQQWRYTEYYLAWELIEAGERKRAHAIMCRLKQVGEERFPRARRDLLDWTLGHLARLDNDIANALVHYGAAWQSNPKLYAAGVGLGWALIQNKEAAKAVAPLKAAILLNPEATEPRTLLIQALGDTSQSQQAERLLTGWVGQVTLDANLAEKAARLLLFRNRDVEAALALRTVIALDPDRIRPAEFAGWLRRNQSFNSLVGALGQALFGLGRHEEALPRFKQALALEPGDGNHRLGLARTYSILGKTREADRHAREYINSLPRTPTGTNAARSLLLALATDHYEARRFAPALRRYGEIESLDKKSRMATTAEATAVLCGLGRCLVGLGKSSRARKYFLDALALDADCVPAKTGLTTLQQKSGR